LSTKYVDIEEENSLRGLFIEKKINGKIRWKISNGIEEKAKKIFEKNIKITPLRQRIMQKFGRNEEQQKEIFLTKIWV